MDRNIHFYLKVCEKREYAEDFVAGRLLMRPLRYFKGLENSPDQRGDPHEAASAWHQPKDINLEIAGIAIDSSDMAAPLVVQELQYDETRLLCLYAGTAPATGVLEEVEQEVQIPAQAFELGQWCVLIGKPKEFQRRFVAACKRDNRNGRGKLVTYFDPDTHSGKIDDPPFWKKKEYAHQREFRFALRPLESDPEMLFFDAGDLSDICEVLPMEQLKRIEVRPKG